MKTSNACSGILASENDDFKFIKHVKNIKASASRAPWFQCSCNCFISPNQYVADQKHERKSNHGAVVYIFQNIEI